jgi:dTDP-4-amino-4,6-dideoxygalactose transaminase
MINYGKQTLKENDLKAVIKALRKNFLTSGPGIEKFEKDLIKKFGGKFCSVVNNGTSALNIVGKVLGWKKGDNIITTPLSFLATANCIVNNNATPVFSDVENKSFTLDPEKLEDKLRKMPVKAVIGVDYAGHPCDWESLRYLSKKYNFKLINDACHSMGSKLNDNIKYATYYSDFVTQSFHPVKAITTGEGGSIFSKDKKIANKIVQIRSHSMHRTKKEGPWYYEIHEAGSNFRITDFQCALGISQLKKLNNFIKVRRKIASIYLKELKDDERFIIPVEKPNCFHSFHIFPLQVNFDKIKIDKKELFKKFEKKGIKLQVHYIPIHLQPFYKKKFGYKNNQFPVAEKFYKKEISLPLYPDLKSNEL